MVGSAVLAGRASTRRGVVSRQRLRLGAALLVAFVFALVLAPAPEAHAATGKVLVLSTTVTGGLSSREASYAASLGLTVDLVTPATWATMTEADFASYRAIILGDPTCAENPTPVAAAAANASTWGPAVTGNTIIIGTDPVYHAPSKAGAAELIKRGIDFAIAYPNRTGAYITLSCYYHSSSPNTAVPLLDGLEATPGQFKVRSSGCNNKLAVTSTYPTMAGLTSADLSDWGCSTHEFFDTYGADFVPLAIAVNPAGTYAADDGTVGFPVIVARGIGLTPCTASDVSLGGSFTPSTLVGGTDGTLTLTVTNRGACKAFNTRVRFDPSTFSAHVGTPTMSSGSWDVTNRTWTIPLVDLGATATLTVAVGPSLTTPPGDHYIEADIIGGPIPADPTPDDFSLTLPFTATPAPPGAIEGTVTADGVPVAGIHIALYNARIPWFTFGHRVTAADGTYQFADLKRGEYRLRVRDFSGVHQSGWLSNVFGSATAVHGLTQPSTEAIVVTNGVTTTKDITLAPRAPGSIGGLVTDSSDAPRGRVWVQVLLPMKRDLCSCPTDAFMGFVAGTVTGSNGGFTVRGLPAGRYYLRFVDLDGVHPPIWYRNAVEGFPPEVTGIDVTTTEVTVMQRLP